MITQSFKVSLSMMDNPDKLKFVIVEDCKDMDECIDHIYETEKGWIINAIKQL